MNRLRARILETGRFSSRAFDAAAWCHTMNTAKLRGRHKYGQLTRELNSKDVLELKKTLTDDQEGSLTAEDFREMIKTATNVDLLDLATCSCWLDEAKTMLAIRRQSDALSVLSLAASQDAGLAALEAVERAAFVMHHFHQYLSLRLPRIGRHLTAIDPCVGRATTVMEGYLRDTEELQSQLANLSIEDFSMHPDDAVFLTYAGKLRAWLAAEEPAISVSSRLEQAFTGCKRPDIVQKDVESVLKSWTSLADRAEAADLTVMRP